MPIPRWLQFLFLLIGINLAAVVVTSAWHLASAQAAGLNPPASQSPTDENQLPSAEPGSLPADVPSLSFEATPELKPQGTQDAGGTTTDSKAARNGLGEPGLPLPEQLPELPEPNDADLAHDPIFQEFQRMFGDAAASKAPQKNTSPRPIPYASLENRLEVVRALVDASQGLAREAQELQERGANAQAAELTKMAEQCRQTAAALLVREF